MRTSLGLPSETLDRLNATLNDQPISRELHAFTRLCPPEAASHLLALPADQLRKLSDQCHTAINEWLCSSRTYDVMRDAPSLTTRDSSLPGKTKDRDRSCVITGVGRSGSQAAHIIPYSVGKSQARAHTDLWEVLRMFWGNEEVESLQSLVYGENVPDENQKTRVNCLDNVITLYRHWQRAVFHWIFPNGSARVSPGEYSPISLTADLPTRSYIGTSEDEDTSLMYNDGGQARFIQDGHVVVFRTDDPDHHPLPSMELLWLQDTLVRVTRTAGRAGWDLREMNYSETDVDSIREVDETVLQSWSQTMVQGERSTSSCRISLQLQPKHSKTPSRYRTKSIIKRVREAKLFSSLCVRAKGWLKKKSAAMPTSQVDRISN
ncbi:MAG: hypothetical protein M1840_000455 [Geoglossum simile]|nr:MAG: hypothetical protein M1840_000455 [Geoglossum simile]